MVEAKAVERFAPAPRILPLMVPLCCDDRWGQQGGGHAGVAAWATGDNVPKPTALRIGSEVPFIDSRPSACTPIPPTKISRRRCPPSKILAWTSAEITPPQH